MKGLLKGIVGFAADFGHTGIELDCHHLASTRVWTNQKSRNEWEKGRENQFKHVRDVRVSFMQWIMSKVLKSGTRNI